MDEDEEGPGGIPAKMSSPAGPQWTGPRVQRPAAVAPVVDGGVGQPARPNGHRIVWAKAATALPREARATTVWVIVSLTGASTVEWRKPARSSLPLPPCTA